MNRRGHIFSAITLSGAIILNISSCRTCLQYEDPGLLELYNLPTSNPQIAASAAIARFDDTFIGISGFGVSLPGLSLKEQVEVLRQRRYRLIVGTRDFEVDSALESLTKIAMKYAETYNICIKSKSPIIFEDQDSHLDK